MKKSLLAVGLVAITVLALLCATGHARAEGMKSCHCGFDAGGECKECTTPPIENDTNRKVCSCGYTASGECVPCEEREQKGCRCGYAPSGECLPCDLQHTQ